MNNKIIDTQDYPGGFDVTGIDRYGKRFKQHYSQAGACVAFNINLWNGSVWGIRADGTRQRLKRVVN